MLSHWFLTRDVPLELCATVSHNSILALLSYLVAAFAAYTAFDLLARVRAAANKRRRLWLAAAGLSMGSGIWAMHFIAMLAVEIPIPVRFDPLLTALSAFFAVIASATAFALIAAKTLQPVRLALASVVLGSGIGLMHYTGMAALRMPAHIYYDPRLFALSVVVAVALSAVALLVLTALQKLKGRRLAAARVTGALVMGLAIVLMHYTGMFATWFLPVPEPQQSGMQFDPSIMAATVAIVSFLIVAFTTAAAWLEQRVENAETLLRDAIESFAEGFVVYNDADRLVMCNEAYRRMYAECADLLVAGTSYQDIVRRGIERGKYPDALGRESEWLAERLHERREAMGSFERRLGDGSWMLISDRKMSNGATAGLRVDISKLKSAQEALQESEQRLDRAQEIAGIGSWELDLRTHRAVWSRELYRIRGVPEDRDIPTLEFLDKHTHPDDLPRFKEWLALAGQGVTCEPVEYRIIRGDGEIRVVRGEARPLHDPDGTISRLTGTLQDVTERRRTEQQLDAALNNLTQGVSFFDGRQRLILANRRYAEIYGLSMGSIRPGRTLEQILDMRRGIGTCPTMARDEYLSWRMSLQQSDEPNDTIVELKSGQIISIHHQPMPDGGWTSTHEDITDRRRAEQRLTHIARHDALTGLPNRVVFREYVEQDSDRRDRKESVAVLCLDLDRFKYVNDTFGHPTGDALLRCVAERISANVRAQDIVMRLGGDEFAIIQVGVEQPTNAASLAERLIDVLSQPYVLGSHQAVIGTSVGIAFCPTRTTDAETLLKNADMALYKAKATGKGRYCFYDPDMDREAHEHIALEAGLRRALTDSEFELWFQPVMNAQTERVTRFEALIRWRHPERGLVAPSEFIAIAEEVGLIVPIGAWLINEACRIASTWPAEISVAVNVSARQLKNIELIDVIEEALRQYGLAAHRLELEVTETVLLENSAAALAPLHRLRDLGLRIALDDFGTGFSSIGCLLSFPFDKVKIDRSFVSGLDSRPEAAAVVHAIVDLGAALGMIVTAEGVETEAQLRQLRAEACSEVQGYLFSPPRPEDDVAALIRRFNQTTETDAYTSSAG